MWLNQTFLFVVVEPMIEVWGRDFLSLNLMQPNFMTSKSAIAVIRVLNYFYNDRWWFTSIKTVLNNQKMCIFFDLWKYGCPKCIN